MSAIQVENLPKSRAARWAALLEKQRLPALAIFSVIYFAGTIARANAKPFWHDELYTLLLSRLDLHSLWNALAHGADASPPLTYLALHWTRMLFGENEITMRLPSMIGFWVFCLGLYGFVHRRMGAQYAFAAALLPFATGAHRYAFEARCYGEMLGFCGLALVCWQAAVEGRHRVPAIIGLALSFAGMTFSHYYGAVIFVPFGAAELWRAVRRRSLDFGIAAAFVAGLVPLAVCYPMIRAARMYTPHAWARPTAFSALDFFSAQLITMVFAAVLFLAVFGAWLLFRNSDWEPDWRAPSIPEPEIVLALGFLTIPVIIWVAAMTVTHMFTDRYALPALVGVILLSLMLVRRLARANTAIPALFLGVSTFAFLFGMAHRTHRGDPLQDFPLLRQAIDKGPVAIDDGLIFFQAWYYLPPERKRLVYYLDDPASAAAYTGTDTIDLNFRTARPWIPFPLANYGSAKSLLLYHNANRPVWPLARFLHDGARVEVLEESGYYSILRVTMPETR